MDESVDWCLSVFVDNAGIVKFDDKHAVWSKVEINNDPSTLEPDGVCNSYKTDAADDSVPVECLSLIHIDTADE